MQLGCRRQMLSHPFCIIYEKQKEAIMSYRYDEDLEFLRSMQSTDLDTLVEILIGKEGSGNFTEELTMNPLYKKFYPDHIKYIEEIMGEIQCFGGNTFATMLRGGKGVLYKEILCDVCDKMKVNYNKNSSVERIEGELFAKILEKAIEQMDSKELEQIVKEINKGTNISSALGFGKQAALVAMQSAIKAGGFYSYQLALIVANAVAKQVIGRGLTFAANAGLTRAMSVFAGPIGWVITGLWTGVDLAGPAYRITIPAVIEVAYLRLRHSNTHNVFLTGETGVGKDTIFHILKEGKFMKDWHTTTNLEYETFDACRKTLKVINTGGQRENDDENIDARRGLESNTKYVYVFRADDYLTNEKVKEQVQMDLQNHKELCDRKGYTLKIIGTHKDKCLERGISQTQIQNLSSEISKNGECQILDLTQFSDEQRQQELCDFITD